MIIKSMSRKEPSFGQLIAYMSREVADDAYRLYYNCYSRKPDTLETEFQENASHLRARKNGVFLYHEILSIERQGVLSDAARKEKLFQIAREYIQMRCPKALVYGVIHDDHKHHLHYHLMISANEVGSEKRQRLSKADFAALKVQLERRVLSNYPELSQKVAIEKKAKPERRSQAGEELKRRSGSTPKRDDAKEKIAGIFADCLDRQELFDRLQASSLELYVRGKNIGVKDQSTGYKYRLSTLGLTERFEALSRRIEALAGVETAAQQIDQPEDTSKQQPEIRTPEAGHFSQRESSAPEARHEPPHAQKTPEPEQALESEIDRIARERAQKLKKRAEEQRQQEAGLKRDR